MAAAAATPTSAPGGAPIDSKQDTPAPKRPVWMSEKRASNGGPITFKAALIRGVETEGLFPCSICDKLDSVPHQLGGFNWCPSCVKKLLDCGMCGKRAYFQDSDTWKAETKEACAHYDEQGCVECGAKKASLNCSSCKRSWCDSGKLWWGNLTCTKCVDGSKISRYE